MKRRRFLSLAGATAAMTCAPLIARAATRTGPRRKWRIPADFERTRAVWLGYDGNTEFTPVTARIAAAIAPHAKLVVVADDPEKIPEARRLLAGPGYVDRITFLHNPAARFFIRDYNVFAVAPGQLGVVDFQFNTYGLPGWCADHLYPDEPERASKCAGYGDPDAGALDRWISGRLRAKLFRSPLFLEGGAIEVNGRGTLLISEPLALQRNPGMSRSQIQSELLRLPGIRKIIWLAEGVAEDPQMKATLTGDYIGFGAGYHVDEFARFADPRTILLASVERNGKQLHPIEAINAERTERNFRVLSKATDQDGRPFKIIRVPMPTPIERDAVLQAQAQDMETWTASVFPAREGRNVGDRLTHVAAAGYLNYLVANGLVLVPSYVEDGTPAARQNRVREVFQRAFPGRRIEFINVTRLNWSGGGIHCATCNEPLVATV